jgi:HSP20 family molecular chaperone IbpA
LWAEPSTGDGEGIDRTIALATPVRDGDVTVTYDDPTLTVAVQKPERR